MVGEIGGEAVSDGACLFGSSPARIEQEHLVESLGHLLEGRIVTSEACERLGSEGEVLEVVLLDDTGVVESVHDYLVRLLLGFGCERKLGEIVFSPVRVVGCTDGIGCRFFLNPLFGSNAVLQGTERVIGFVVIALRLFHGNHRAVGAPPVVLVFSVTPTFSEVLLALHDEERIVEIPCAVFGIGIRVRVGVGVGVVSVPSILVLSHAGGSSTVLACLAFFLLLFLQRFDDAVNGSVSLRLGHEHERLQAVLEMHGRGEGHKFVEHFGASGGFRIAFPRFIDERQRLCVASLCVGEVPFFPVEFRKSQHQDALFNSFARALFASFFVSRNRLRGVAER